MQPARPGPIPSIKASVHTPKIMWVEKRSRIHLLAATDKKKTNKSFILIDSANSLAIFLSRQYLFKFSVLFLNLKVKLNIRISSFEGESANRILTCQMSYLIPTNGAPLYPLSSPNTPQNDRKSNHPKFTLNPIY